MNKIKRPFTAKNMLVYKKLLDIALYKLIFNYDQLGIKKFI